MRADSGPSQHSVRSSGPSALRGYGEALPPAPLPVPAGGRALARPAGRAAAGLRSWVAAHRMDLAIVGALTALVAVVHGINMGSSPAFFDDEGTYVSQAWSVTNLGELAPYTYWYDHPPLGWLAMAVWSVFAQPFSGGNWAIADFRVLMLVLTLVSALLLYAIALRLRLSRPFAVLAAVLFVLSPLSVHYGRMVLLDNLAVPWMLAAFALALSPRRQLAAYAAAGFCFAAAVLTKETFLLVLPALLLLVWQRAEGPTRAFAMTLALTGFGLTAAFYPLFALLQGELLPGSVHTSLWDGISFQLSRPGTGSIIDAGSGTRQLIDDWLREDALLLPAAFLLAPFALAFRRLLPIALAFLLPLAVAMRPGSYVPAMFVLGLLPFAAVLVAGVADGVWHRLQGWRESRSLPRTDPRSRLGAIASTPAAQVGLVAVVLLAAGTQWAGANLDRMSNNEQAAGRLAVDWIDGRVPRDSTLLVDDTVWVDLVERGFAPERTIWFYKLDLDPAVKRPWQQVDYVLRSNIMEGNAKDLPLTRAALKNSRTVAQFSAGEELMELRRVVAPPTASRRPRGSERGPA